MFKDIYNTIALVIPSIAITYFASNLLDRNYEQIRVLKQQIVEPFDIEKSSLYISPEEKKIRREKEEKKHKRLM